VDVGIPVFVTVYSIFVYPGVCVCVCVYVSVSVSTLAATAATAALIHLLYLWPTPGAKTVVNFRFSGQRYPEMNALVNALRGN
jgi:hypothetical protein